MDKLEIFHAENPEAAVAWAGEALNQLLGDYKKLPVLLMLSGGSALSMLDYVGKTVLSENLTVSMLDDRFSQDAAVNNFLQMQKTDFYVDAQEADVSFLGTVARPGEKIEELNARWEKNLKAWQMENPEGKILATVGMGADGHTAGIFPYPEDPEKFDRLFNRDSLTVAYNAIGKHKYSERVTTTLKFFEQIDEAVILVTGVEKKQKLEEVLAKKNQPNELPALAWYQIKKATLVTELKNFSKS